MVLTMSYTQRAYFTEIFRTAIDINSTKLTTIFKQVAVVFVEISKKIQHYLLVGKSHFCLKFTCDTIVLSMENVSMVDIFF